MYVLCSYGQTLCRTQNLRFEYEANVAANPNNSDESSEEDNEDGGKKKKTKTKTKDKDKDKDKKYNRNKKAGQNDDTASITSTKSNNTRSSTATSAPQRSTAPFSFLVNFPDNIDENNMRRATIVHLDTSIGDMRQVQAILRALAVFLYQENFAERLDVEDEYVLPFANGVLDLRYGVLRPGRPEDMVMRGPSYQWHLGGGSET